jgi:hypothetical protein
MPEATIHGEVPLEMVSTCHYAHCFAPIYDRTGSQWHEMYSQDLSECFAQSQPWVQKRDGDHCTLYRGALALRNISPIRFPVSTGTILPMDGYPAFLAYAVPMSLSH